MATAAAAAGAGAGVGGAAAVTGGAGAGGANVSVGSTPGAAAMSMSARKSPVAMRCRSVPERSVVIASGSRGRRGLTKERVRAGQCGQVGERSRGD